MNLGQPFLVSDDGSYVTLGQVKFFCSSSTNLTPAALLTNKKFLTYLNSCRVYNLISDLIREDDSNAYMYWDSKSESIRYAFPVSGVVWEELDKRGFDFSV